MNISDDILINIINKLDSCKLKKNINISLVCSKWHEIHNISLEKCNIYKHYNIVYCKRHIGYAFFDYIRNSFEYCLNYFNFFKFYK